LNTGLFWNNSVQKRRLYLTNIEIMIEAY